MSGLKPRPTVRRDPTQFIFYYHSSPAKSTKNLIALGAQERPGLAQFNAQRPVNRDQTPRRAAYSAGSLACSASASWLSFIALARPLFSNRVERLPVPTYRDRKRPRLFYPLWEVRRLPSTHLYRGMDSRRSTSKIQIHFEEFQIDELWIAAFQSEFHCDLVREQLLCCLLVSSAAQYGFLAFALP